MKKKHKTLHSLFLIIEIISLIVLSVSCFLPWVYFDVLHQTFNGVYSFNNIYGKPYKFILFCNVLWLLSLMITKKNMAFVQMAIFAFLSAYLIRSVLLYSNCDYTYGCPQIKIGLYGLAYAYGALLLSFFLRLKYR